MAAVSPAGPEPQMMTLRVNYGQPPFVAATGRTAVQVGVIPRVRLGAAVS